MKPAKNIERLIKKLRYNADTQIRDRVLGNILQKMDESQKHKAALSPPNIWRTVIKSRVPKLCAAALIIIAITVCLHRFADSVNVAGVAWGELPQRVQRIPTATYRRTVVSPQGPLGSAITEEIVYLSGHKVRVDSFGMAGVNPHFHWLSIDKPPLGLRVHQYAQDTDPPYGGVLVYLESDPNRPSSDPGMDIYENLKCWWREQKHIDLNIDEYLSRGFRTSYFFLDERVRIVGGVRRPLSERVALNWYKHVDPREWVKEVLSQDYKKLGRDNINGVDVEGVEATGPNLSVTPIWRPDRDVTIRFWVDVQTGLPVRYEARARLSLWEGDSAMVVDEIHWNEPLDPGIFEPNVPVE